MFGYKVLPQRLETYPACTRCGMPGTRRFTYVDGLCPSCTAEPADGELTYVRGGREIRCLPWQGDYDDDDNPLLPDGSLAAPGPRSCGHSDCVSVAHVGKRPKNREAEKRRSAARRLVAA